MSKTNIGLVEYVKKAMVNKDNNIYLLGTFGRTYTKADLDRSASNYAFTAMNYDFYLRWIDGKRKAYDCVGLIKAYIWDEKDGKTNYVASQDQNVGMMYNAATVKGKFKDMPDVVGMLAMTGDFGHVGVYIGRDSNGVRQYIESTPNWHVTGEWGIVQSNDNNRKWDYFAKYALIDYVDVEETIKPEVKPDPKPNPQPEAKDPSGTVYVKGEFINTSNDIIYYRSQPNFNVGIDGYVNKASRLRYDRVYNGNGFQWIGNGKLWLPVGKLINGGNSKPWGSFIIEGAAPKPEVKPKPQAKDQILHVGEKFIFNSVYKVSNMKFINGVWAVLDPRLDAWISVALIDKTDANGNKTPNQVMAVGNYFKVPGTFVVEKVDASADKVYPRGWGFGVKAATLYEV